MPLCVSLWVLPLQALLSQVPHTHRASRFPHTTIAHPSWCWGLTKHSAGAVGHMVRMPQLNPEVCSHLY